MDRCVMGWRNVVMPSAGKEVAAKTPGSCSGRDDFADLNRAKRRGGKPPLDVVLGIVLGAISPSGY